MSGDLASPRTVQPSLPNDKLATDGLGLRDSYRIAKRVRRLHLGGWLEFRVTIYIFLIWGEFLTSLNSFLETYFKGKYLPTLKAK